MGKKTRTIVTIAAGAGWAIAFGITISTQHVDMVRDYPHFFSRLFALFSLASAVLTLGLWFERTRGKQTQSAPAPVDTAFHLGLRAGRRIAKLNNHAPPAGTVPADDPTWWWNHVIDQQGQQDTPPAGWRTG